MQEDASGIGSAFDEQKGFAQEPSDLLTVFEHMFIEHFRRDQVFVAAIRTGRVCGEQALFRHFLHSVAQGAFREVGAGEKVFERFVKLALLGDGPVRHHVIEVPACRRSHVRQVLKFPQMQGGHAFDQCREFGGIHFIMRH